MGTPGAFSHSTRSQVTAMLLSVALAATATLMMAAKREEHFLNFRIQPDHATSVRLLANHSGHYEDWDTASLVGSGEQAYFRLLRLHLHRRMVDNLRLDFTREVEHVAIKSMHLADKDGTPLYDIDVKDVTPLRDVIVNTLADDTIDLRVTGPQPQIALKVQWWMFFMHNFHPGLLISLPLLFYPFISLATRLVKALFFSSTTRPANGRMAQHLFFPAASLTCWVLVVPYILQVRGEHEFIRVNKHSEVLYQKDASADVVTITRPDGLLIAGKVYHPKNGAKEKAAILLLHGNFAQGQSFPMYPILATELSLRGYLVLTIDLAGFGKSEDPYSSPTPKQVDYETETDSALIYLKQICSSPQTPIGIIGHSLGAEPALKVGLEHPLVGTIMLIGPPRRVWERYHTPEDIKYFWNRALEEGRLQYGRNGFPAWYGQELWLEDILQRDIRHLLPRIVRWTHKPILFMDGERELELDRSFLRFYVNKVSYPKRYVTIEGLTHHFNVQWFRHPLFFDPEGMDKATDILAQWCEQTADGGNSLIQYCNNTLHWLFKGVRLFVEREFSMQIPARVVTTARPASIQQNQLVGDENNRAPADA